MRATRTELVRETARRLLNEQHRRAAEEIARLNAAGYLTAKQVADERKVTDSAVYQWVRRRLLTAERRLIEDEEYLIVRREEFDRFNAEEWPRILQRMGPRFPRNWRGPARRLWSRRLRAPVVGSLHKPSYTNAQGTLARKIKAKYPKLGRETIADMVSEATGQGMTPKQVRHALRQKPPI